MSFDPTTLPWLPAAPVDLRKRIRALDLASPDIGLQLQQLASYQLDAANALSLGRVVRKCGADGVLLPTLRPIRLTILSGSTYDFIVDALPAAGLRRGLALSVSAAPYDQAIQQACDPGSWTHQTPADLMLLAVDHRWLGLTGPDLSEAGMEAAAIARLEVVCDGLETGGRRVVLQTLATPPIGHFGSYDGVVNGGLPVMISNINAWIRGRAQRSGWLVLDIASLSAQVGSARWFDPVALNLYKVPFASAVVPLYCDWLARLIGASAGTSRKCLVLDLDNTLWGGAIGDEGLGGITLGNGSAEGEAFLSVQSYARALSARGVILAVSSKNYETVARTPFQSHPDMILKESDIAVFQANWTDKAANLEAIAKTLNIGMDALVLLDDNPVERAQVRQTAPAVAVPELPTDPAHFVTYLSAAGYFESVSFSDEDRSRTASYVANTERLKVQASAKGTENYLDDLQMVIRFDPFDAIGRTRIHQLVGKSNQFNLTTKRYDEHDLARFESDVSSKTLQVRLRDRFGDFGMIGVVICTEQIEPEGPIWVIDTWLMSCRVLGRKVEQGILNHLVEAAQARGIAQIEGRYVPTAKNMIVERHYDQLGFDLIAELETGERLYRLDTRRFIPFPLPMAVDPMSG